MESLDGQDDSRFQRPLRPSHGLVSLNRFPFPSLLSFTSASCYRSFSGVVYLGWLVNVSLHAIMSLLDHLWDDTVAGPRPEAGLGKLRKNHTFNSRSTSGKESDGVNLRSSSFGGESMDEAMKVTRSIMIVKPPGYQSSSPPVSPASSTPPASPFSGGRESLLFRRRSASNAYEKESQIGGKSPRSSYDV